MCNIAIGKNVIKTINLKCILVKNINFHCKLFSGYSRNIF